MKYHQPAKYKLVLHKWASYLEKEGLHFVLKEVEADLIGQQNIILKEQISSLDIQICSVRAEHTKT